MEGFQILSVLLGLVWAVAVGVHTKIQAGEEQEVTRRRRMLGRTRPDGGKMLGEH